MGSTCSWLLLLAAPATLLMLPLCAAVSVLLCGCGRCSVWFAAVEVVFILAGRNFMMEYMQDWNPKEVSPVLSNLKLKLHQPSTDDRHMALTM